MATPAACQCIQKEGPISAKRTQKLCPLSAIRRETCSSLLIHFSSLWKYTSEHRKREYIREEAREKSAPPWNAFIYLQHPAPPKHHGCSNHCINGNLHLYQDPHALYAHLYVQLCLCLYVPYVHLVISTELEHPALNPLGKDHLKDPHWSCIRTGNKTADTAGNLGHIHLLKEWGLHKMKATWHSSEGS